MASKGRGGVKRAEEMQEAWTNYLSAYEEFKKNKTVKDVQSDIDMLRKEYGLSKG